MARQDIRNAAMVLLSLPDSVAAQVLRRLSLEHLESVAFEMLALEEIDPADRHRAIQAFSNGETLPFTEGIGGFARAERLIRLAVDDGQDLLIDRLREHKLASAITTLSRLDDRLLAGLLDGEHLQTIAVVLARLDTRRVAAVLERLRPEQRLGIIRRIACIGPGTVEWILEVFDALLERSIQSLRVSIEPRPLPLAS